MLLGWGVGGDQGIVPLELVNLHRGWGGGGGPTPHPTSWVWAAPNTPEDPAPVDKSHHLHPHCSRTGKEGTGSAPRPQSSCYRAGHPAEGKEPGETLEVPVSPDEARGPLPGGSASCPLSTPTPAKPRARHPVPYHQPTRNKSSENTKLCF